MQQTIETQKRSRRTVMYCALLNERMRRTELRQCVASHSRARPIVQDNRYCSHQIHTKDIEKYVLIFGFATERTSLRRLMQTRFPKYDKN